METQSDSFVMQQVQMGDTAQLAVLFERHHLALYRYLLHLTGNSARSEDLVQEVFFRILKYARSFNPAQPFSVWLYQLARNVNYDALRKHRAEAGDDGLTEIRSTEPAADERLTRREDVRHLEQALRNLPPDKREVLVLSRFQNLPYDEIARILDCEIGAVKVRVYRALRQLREVFCELRGERTL